MRKTVCYIDKKNSRRSEILLNCFKDSFPDDKFLVVPGFLDTIKPWLGSIAASKYWYYVKYFLLILSYRKNFDVVFIPDQNFINKWVAFVVSFLLRKPVEIDFYVSEYDVKVNDRIVWNSNSIKSILLKMKERFMLKNASRVYFLSKTDRAYHLKTLNISIEEIKTDILPLVVSIEPVSSDSLICRSDPVNLRLVWWGSFNKIHGLDIVFHALGFLSKRTDFAFSFDVYGVNKNKGRPFMKLAQELSIMEFVNFNFDKSFSDGTLRTAILNNRYDVSIGLFGETLKAKKVISNKLVESLALGILHFQIESDALGDFSNLRGIVLTSKVHPEIIAEKLYSLYEKIKQRDSELLSNRKLGIDLFNSLFSCRAMSSRMKLLYENS